MTFDVDAIRSTLGRIGFRGRKRPVQVQADCPQCEVGMMVSGPDDRTFWVCPDCDGIALA